MHNMIPVLPKEEISPVLKNYIEALKRVGFKGDIQVDLGARIACSMDNSIYQVVPECVLYPKDKQDILYAFQVGNQDTFKALKFSPRGGGTGTNGQSLSPGIIIDCSRYMNQILEVNSEQKWVKVEPAVVLDQLNESVKNTGLFFAPNLSPSNRATLGGMVNTDACGKGSRLYGRTSQHILEIEFICVDGSEIKTQQISFEILEKKLAQQNKEGEIYRVTNDVITQNAEEIENRFPKLARFMTGYNLAKVIDQENKTFNLNYLLSGSEGTLVYVVGLKLNLVEIPKFKSLFALQYPTFKGALRAAKDLLEHHPAAVETIDDNILALAREDEIFNKVAHMIIEPEGKKAGAINLVEVISDSQDDLLAQEKAITEKLKVLIQADKLNAYYHTNKPNEIAELWNLRKKGVGLLGNMKGDNKPIPFMEDTAVPPENLADYIVELRQLLDSYHLRYGMFGHVDVGCLHMRPALDMSTESHQKLVPVLTSQVNELVRKYGGVYWSEHGKGFRSEYVQQYFGDKLYAGLAEIKQTFDKDNRLNPGKIVVPKGSKEQLVKVDGPYKGYVDTKIDKRVRQKYAGAFNCNGNAACLNYDYNDVICPSAKLSRNWVYSPKGRSGLVREWLHQLSNKNYIGVLTTGEPEFGHQIKSWFKKSEEQKNDYSHEVYESMEKCLGCKACASSCPVKVDIPTMRSQFLSQYHTRYARPSKDYFIAMVEKIAHYQSYLPTASNYINQLKPVQWMMSKFVGLTDLPKLSTNKFNKSLAALNAPKFDIHKLKNLSDSEKSKSVCLVQDAFNSYYESDVMLDTYDLLTKLGFTVYVLPFRENGKALHTKGFLRHFIALARENTSFYNRIAEAGITLIGIEPSMTLCYRDEYVKTLGSEVKFKVQLVNEWLAQNLDGISLDIQKPESGSFDLYPHCSEKALALESTNAWQKIFNHFGMQTKIAKTGCCGMAGTYGHETKHIEGSKKLYDMSWKEAIRNSELGNKAMVTGFSCRCQVKRMENTCVKHPVTVLKNNFETLNSCSAKS